MKEAQLDGSVAAAIIEQAKQQIVDLRNELYAVETDDLAEAMATVLLRQPAEVVGTYIAYGAISYDRIQSQADGVDQMTVADTNDVERAFLMLLSMVKAVVDLNYITMTTGNAESVN